MHGQQGGIMGEFPAGEQVMLVENALNTLHSPLIVVVLAAFQC
jgi:orotate phosphoribosyltransferase